MADSRIRKEALTLVERSAEAAMREVESVLVDGGAQLAEVYIFVRAVEGTVPGDEEDLAQATSGKELPEDTMERAIHIVMRSLTLATMTARDSGIMIGTLMPPGPFMMSDN